MLVTVLPHREITRPQPCTPAPPCFTPSKDHLKTGVSQRDPGKDAVTDAGMCPSPIISHSNLMEGALKSQHSAAWAPIGGEGKPLLGGFNCSRQAAPPTLGLGNWRSTAQKDPSRCLPHNPCKAEAAAHTPGKPPTPGD